MSQVFNSIIEQARAAGINEQVISTLSRRDLCSLINSIQDLNAPGAEVSWDIAKELDEKDGKVLVEWVPTCASRKDFINFRKQFPIESFEENKLSVEWKPSWIPATDFAKQGIRTTNEILEKKGNLIKVSWNPSCIDLPTYQQEQSNVEKVLSSDAILIRWKPTWTLKARVVKVNAEEEEEEKPKSAKRQKTCAAAPVDRTFDPTLDNIAVEAGFPSDEVLLAGGQTILQGKNRDADKVVNKRWKDAALDDLKKLVYIDNPGNGDCGYYALAPMVRLLKPGLFQGIEQDDIDAAMIRMRQLLAHKLGTTMETINEYVTTYADQFATAKERNSYLKNLIKDGDSVAEKRAKIQSEMIQSSHWLHLSDFSLLRQVLGPTVNIIIMQSTFGARVPPFHLIGDSNDSNAKSIIIYHNANHFVRLQQRDGRFAFSNDQLQQSLPQIYELYQETVKPANVNLELIHLKEDIRANNQGMIGMPVTDDYDAFYERFLGFPKNREIEMVSALIPQVKRYSSLPEAEKLTIQRLLLENRGKLFVDLAPGVKVTNTQTQDSNADDVEIANTQADDDKDYEPNDVEINEKVFCAPLTAEEERQVQQIFKSANSQTEKNFVQIDGVDLNGNILSRLNNKEWLNDEIINLYLKFLVADSTKNVGMFNSHFYDILSGPRGFDGVKGWKVYPLRDKYDQLLIPINANKHWFLCLVDYVERKVIIFDSLCSLGDPKREYFKTIRNYLIKKEVDVAGWNYEIGIVPQQTNSYDCGVFVLGYAKQLVAANFEKFTFKQSDIACFRKRILLEFLRRAE